MVGQVQLQQKPLISVGVSFDQNNQINGSTSNATFYVRGGVPISFPAKDAPFEKFDYGLVVFSTSAENFLGQTIQERWAVIQPHSRLCKWLQTRIMCQT